MDEKSSNQYCRNLVRDRDYNRYLLSFFVPRESRANMLAILALNVELQSITDKTNEPMAALIRLKWWQDEIEKIYNGVDVQSSPILPPLKQSIETHTISNDTLETLFTCYDDIIRGTARDPDDALYGLLSATLPDNRAREKFSKTLQIHDCLDDGTPFREIRLWIGI